MNKLSVEWTHEGRVARLTMTSERNLNAMDEAMAQAFRQARSGLSVARLRAVVISGQGRAFSAGGDLAMLYAKAGKDVETNRLEMLQFYASFLDLRDLEVPLICALHGHSVGAGFCFAAACDLRVADSSARFAAPFTRLGLHPGMGGSYFLPRALGSETARDLMLSGRRMAAEEARERGFLSALVGEGELDGALESLLDGVLQGAPLATRALLRSQREDEREALQRALAREAAEQAACYARPEFLEGLDALSAKRRPGWA
jgi:enoyl-CoA hydratase/carnithine racemase